MKDAELNYYSLTSLKFRCSGSTAMYNSNKSRIGRAARGRINYYEEDEQNAI